VDQEDSEALSEAVVRLLTDRELRQKVMTRGIEFVRAHFDNSRLIVDLARLFIDADPRLGQRVTLP
jgi:glycosyltransferase involved in cell wall biosynthesis